MQLLNYAKNLHQFVEITFTYHHNNVMMETTKMVMVVPVLVRWRLTSLVNLTPIFLCLTVFVITLALYKLQ
jgi:hypothetical protein